jgi:arylsulfatase A-like enzyme
MARILLVGWDDVSWNEATSAVCPRLAAFRATACEAPLTFSHPVCSQSRASILFGSYGKRIGTWHDIGTLMPTPTTPLASLPTLPGTLADAGYVTCLVGKWHCGPHTEGAHWATAPLERGYDEWRAGSRLNLADYRDWQRVDSHALGFTVTEGETQYATQAQLQAAADWWTDHENYPKLFLHVAFNAPHGPLHVPPVSLLAGWPEPGFGASNRAKYLAMLRSADTAFGQLLDMVGDDTAVFLYSDNGTDKRSLPATADETHSKETTFDGGTRVLGLGRWGNNPIGQTEGLQHVQDIAAGILAAAGVQAPAEWDARTTPRTYVLCEAELSDGTVDRCARTLTHKLRQVTDATLGFYEELYDMAADPDELAPLDLGDAGNQAVLGYLRAKLDQAAL